MSDNAFTSMEQSWSFSQKVALAIIPKISSSLSIAGSSYIIYHSIIRLKSRGRGGGGHGTSGTQLRHRLLIGLSVCDLIGSIGFFMSTWAIPKEDDQMLAVFNVGNEFTCNLQGFIIQFGTMSVPLYNASLSVYFYLSVRHGIHRSNNNNNICNLRKVSEFLFHFTSMLFPLVISTIGLISGQYNSTSIGCMTSEYPKGCNNNDEDSQCIRGGNHVKFRILTVIPLTLSIIIIITSFFFLYRAVKRQEEIMGSYSGNYRTTSTKRTNDVNPNRRETKSEKVWRQSLRYIAAFSVTWVPFIVYFCLKLFFKGNSNVTFYSQLLLLSTLPLQGFCNCCVYIRHGNPLTQIIRRLSRASNSMN